jgi:hypothetical protein
MDAGLVEECLQTAEKLVSEFAAELSLPSPMRVETLIRPELPSVLLQSVARSAPFWSLVRTMSAGVSASCSVRLLTGRPAGGLPRVRCAGSLAGNKDGDVSLGRGGYRRARRTAADISHGLPRGAASRHRRACAAASRYGTPADRPREQDAWLHDALAQWQQRYPRVPSQNPNRRRRSGCQPGEVVKVGRAHCARPAAPFRLGVRGHMPSCATW